MDLIKQEKSRRIWFSRLFQQHGLLCARISGLATISPKRSLIHKMQCFWESQWIISPACLLGDLWFPVLSDFWPHGGFASKLGILLSDGVSERAIFIVDKKGSSATLTYTISTEGLPSRISSESWQSCRNKIPR
jgi:hypothetical protein